MLDVRFDPYLDDVLRQHLLRAAGRLQMDMEELADLLDDPEDGLAFLKECGEDAWREYLEDANHRVDDVGWVVTRMPSRHSPEP